MLDSTTKRRIDTARDILVGKVPDPKSQVEQITIALVYKFMDDMDAESEELGGQRKFFSGDFARYGWAKLMRSGLGGHETLNLYAEAIARMPENPGIPALFRDIFKNAFLPYRDPETLRAFLKVIDEFEYDHSERLGDAFEYLLSVLGSQGSAGQFRTPRHIIDFMVQIVDPKKDETVLDPACGTAGFLISAYKHILRANSTPEAVDPNGGDNGTETALHTSKIPAARGDLLTPDERGKLANNFCGYDISPDMVRLSLVNMYLHSFADPHIYEYDTLTSQERWNEHADVILANPPFMSPKGGIRPHNKFSVQSKRSEVLFVDYMAEHLTPTGRAGIIVPEGIIFQSQTAYKQLRKMLVEEYLVAVISLPAGVFQPYSGVKTSILILDRSLAKKADSIGFFKVENDGFDLGAQRRPIDKNDLPQVRAELSDYLERLSEGASIEGVNLTLGLVVPKTKIAASGEYNLSAERHRENGARLSHFPIVPLGDVALIVPGQSPPGESYNEVGNGTPFYQGKTEFGKMFLGEPKKWTTDPRRLAEHGDILMSVRAPVGPVNLANRRVCIGRGLAAIRPVSSRLNSLYIFYVLRSMEAEVTGDTGAAFASINRREIEQILIPLPPLEVQKQIVAEIEGYQKVIDGARAVVENYRPHVPIDPEWPMVELGEVAEIVMGQSPPGASYNKVGQGVPLINGPVEFGQDPFSRTRINQYTTAPTKSCRKGDLILCVRGSTTGRMNIAGYEGCIGRGVAAIRAPDMQLWVNYVIDSLRPRIYEMGVGSTFPNVTVKDLASLPIPIPPREARDAIVLELEEERQAVEANSKLIDRFEKKIQATLARVWGDDGAVAAKETGE